MYQSFWASYRKEFPEFAQVRRPLVGAVIKETRVDKGIRQMDFAKETQINESTLKSIENDHQQATTVDTIERCAKPLGLSVEDIILLGRERDPANFFVLKKALPPKIKGIRERVRAPLEWHQGVRLQFKDFDLTPISAPIATKKDFFVSKINLPPKRAIKNLSLGVHHQVFGFLSAGFNVKIKCADNEQIITTNQGFGFDGFQSHEILNEDEDNGAVIYLVTKFPNFDQVEPHRGPQPKPIDSINIALGIERLRERKSIHSDRPIPVKHLAELTETLDHEQIHKLMRIKKGSSVIYWQKIEDLLSGTGVTMEEFLKWCKNEKDQEIHVATAETRVMIDYHNYHGVKIYSAIPPAVEREFFLGEITVEGKSSVTKKSWERKDKAMIAIYVEEGELEITVGKRRSALPILKGESVYFDGNLGYVIRNPGEVQAKGFFASFPAIQF